MLLYEVKNHLLCCNCFVTLLIRLHSKSQCKYIIPESKQERVLCEGISFSYTVRKKQYFSSSVSIWIIRMNNQNEGVVCDCLTRTERKEGGCGWKDKTW